MTQPVMQLLAYAGVTFAISVALVRGYLTVARRWWLDLPNARSSHVVPTPTGGGIAVIATWVMVTAIAVAFGHLPTGERLWSCAVCCIALGTVGLWDDLRDISRAIRYGVHLGVAATCTSILGLPVQVGSAVGWVFAALALLGFTYLINAFNFMDGIDGLVSGTGSVILAFLALFTGDVLWLLLGAAFAGFLVYNAPPARLFMGDAGSTTLGGLVAIALLSGASSLQGEHLIIFAALLGDSAYTLVRRSLRRENIFRAHHSHIYQRMLRAGHGHGAISASYALATIVLGLLAWFAGPAGGVCGTALWIAAVIGAEVYLKRRQIPFTRPAHSHSKLA